MVDVLEKIERYLLVPVNKLRQFVKDILEYFPLPTPRPQQIQALQYVQEVLQKGYRDIVLEIPTGGGKSLIGATIAAWSNENLVLSPDYKPGAYILVKQKVLQDQIEKELTRLGGTVRAALIKASVEYDCPTFKKCSVGLVDYRCPCVGLGQCAYKLAKRRFITAQVAVTNYAYFLTERQHVGQIEPRHILVCDECHGLTNTIYRAVDVSISEEKMSQFAPSISADLGAIRTLQEFIEWIDNDYLPAVSDQAEIMMALNDSDETIKEAYEVAQHLQKVGGFVERAKANPRGWVFWPEESSSGKITLVARPLDAAPYFNDLIAKHAPVRVYMSAFPGSKAIFCRELGLDPKRVAWFRQSSVFPVENRPVYLLGVGSMSRANQEETLPAALRMVRKIAESHGEQRGIIHTHTYKLAEAVMSALSANGLAKRLIFPKDAGERDAALRLHASTPGTILVSPSVGEGFDFRGDLARWQILVKCPYLSLGSKHTAALAERDSQWYKAETVKHFIQICGRVCRSAEDKGETYVIDSDVAKVLNETQEYLPRWFKAAVMTAQGTSFFTD